MRKLAFAASILGIFVLLGLMIFSSPVKISSPDQLKDLEENQRVVVQGFVIDEKTYDKTKYIYLNTNFTIICNSCPSYSGRNIEVLGTIDKYADKTNIIALKVHD